MIKKRVLKLHILEDELQEAVNAVDDFIEKIPNVIECNCVTGTYSMLMKVAFPSTIELETFIGRLQKFGKTQTQIVFSTPVQPRGLNIEQNH